MPAPSTPPTTEWVVETGAPSQVATLIHNAPASSAAIIARMKVSASPTRAGSTMPFEIVETTSPPAMIAPAVSHRAAMINAPIIDRAREPTAGPTLLATSLAPMLSAM